MIKKKIVLEEYFARHVVKKRAELTIIKASTNGAGKTWVYFSASGPGPCAIIEGEMNSKFSKNILQDNLK